MTFAFLILIACTFFALIMGWYDSFVLAFVLSVVVVVVAGCGGSPPDPEPSFVRMPAPVYVHVEEKHAGN